MQGVDKHLIHFVMGLKEQGDITSPVTSLKHIRSPAQGLKIMARVLCDMVYIWWLHACAAMTDRDSGTYLGMENFMWQ